MPRKPAAFLPAMTADVIPSDLALLDLLRKNGSQTVSQLQSALEVTATAVRQRLTRLLAQGYIERLAEKGSRGRPSHQYSLTPAGRRKTGSNFADLAFALWKEIRGIEDLEVRRGLLQRIARQLAESYAGQIRGETVEERMEEVARVFGERRVPFSVERGNDLPILTALACPYPELAEQDRGICAMERMMFSEMLGEQVRLGSCRLDGGSCCTFEVRPPANVDATPTVGS